jgi:HSP20 family protein
MNNFLTMFEPNKEFEIMQNRLNQLFGRGSGLFPSELATAIDWAPKVDISEDPEKFTLKAELPDVRKEDVKVTFESGLLTLSGERKLEKEEKNKKFHRIERSYGRFARSFQLPDTIDPGKVHAEFKEGLLTVQLPKRSEPKKSAIDIQIN